MIMKKTLSLLLAVIMIAMTFTAFPITANAVDVDAAGTSDVDSENIYPVSDSQGMSDAANAIKNKGAGEYVIELDGNIDNGAGISFKGEGVKVTIIGNGHYFHCPAGQNVQAWDGATLILGDENTGLTLIGGETNDNSGVVYVVGKESRCEMNNGVTIKDNVTSAYFGGGVSVISGTFIMNGGMIENCGVVNGSLCYGGGVGVINGGSFTMKGGTIKDCYVKNETDTYTDYLRPTTAGGGVFVCRADFTMTGGSIIHCSATNNNKMASGGGVAVINSTQSNNEHNSDLGYSDSSFTMTGGEIAQCECDQGGGALVFGLAEAWIEPMLTKLHYSWMNGSSNPGLFLSGGKMDHNSAGTYGGAIFINMIRQTIPVNIKNMEISTNNAANGGGIAVRSYWVKTNISNCEITGNTAQENGGGLCLLTNESPGRTSLKDTAITDNTSGGRGAGVYYDEKSSLYISGADVIQNNKHDGKLNNLNILSVEKPVYVDGDLSNSKIGLSDPTLWDDGKEDTDADAVSTIRLTEGYKAYNDSLVPADAFTSDHESWYVDYGEKKTEQGAIIGGTYTYNARTYAAVSRRTGSKTARNTLVDVVAKTTFSNGERASTPTELYNEITARYTEEYQRNNTNEYYDPVSGDSISVYPANGYVYIYVNNSLRLITHASYQQYVDKGHFALVFFSGYLDEAEFSDEYTEKTVVFDEPIDEDETKYEFNDIGHMISKTVCIKSSEVADIQYDTVTTDYTNEVRLVRKNTVDYHINNDEIIAASYNDNDDTTDDDIFTDEITAAGTTVTVGDTINKFYTIPEVVPTDTNSCPYIFKGWYYDKENDNDSRPVQFGTDKYAKDIYAHWIKVENVTKDENDLSMLQSGEITYGGFDLAGVQIRQSMLDKNFNEITPGGMRFITSLSIDVVKKINALQPDNPNNIEYGYVAAKYDGTSKSWIDYHDGHEKLQYVSDGANGINTTNTTEKDEDYFGFAHNVKCTSSVANRVNNEVRRDHQNYDEYLLYSFVVTYEGADATGKDIDVLARPYIHYTDANGSERVAYSEYLGNANKIGGCCISYNDIVAPSGN